MDLHMQNFLLECMCREHTGQVWPILCYMYVSVEDWVPESENLRFELDNALEQAVDMWNLYATSYTFYSMKTAHPHDEEGHLIDVDTYCYKDKCYP